MSKFEGAEVKFRGDWMFFVYRLAGTDRSNDDHLLGFYTMY